MDIGDLTGRVEIEDQFSSVLDLVMRKVESFTEDFDGAMGALAIGVGVGVTAVAAMTAAVTALGDKGSSILGVENAFDKLAEQAGTTGAVLRESLVAGVKDTITEYDLMSATSRLMSSGMKLNADDALLMGQAARELGKATGTDATGGLEMLSAALTTGRVRGLQQQIGIIDLTKGEQEYAASLGLTVSQLTESGKLEGKRIAILDATRDYVERLGESTLTFKERVQQVEASVTEWVEKFSTWVASSADVNTALSTIEKAMGNTFGNGSTLMGVALDAVNSFARGVTAVTPIVMGFVNAGVSLVSFLMNYREVVEAVVAATVLYTIATAIATSATEAAAAAKLEDAVASSGVIKYLTDLVYWTRTLGVEYGFLPTVMKSARGVLSDMGLGFVSTAGSVGGLNIALTGTALIAGQVAIGLTALAAIVTVGYQLWQKHAEEVERDAAAARQAGIDHSNLAILNAKLNTSFTDINAASQEWIKRNKDAKPVIDEESAATKAAAMVKDAYDKSVQSVVTSVIKMGTELLVNRDAYAELGNKVLFTVDAQNAFTAAMDKQIASGLTLTATEKARYEMITSDRVATIDYGVELLKNQGVTLAYIDSLKAQGLTEAEIIEKLGTKKEAYQALDAELMNEKSLNAELSDLEMAASGHVADIAIAQHKREYDDAVALLDKKSSTYNQDLANYKAVEDLKDAASATTTALSISDTQAAANAAVVEYNRMVESGNYFRDALDAQLDKVHKLQDAMHGLGTATVATASNGKVEFDSMGAAIMAVDTTALDPTRINVRGLDGEVTSLADAIKKLDAGNSQDVTSQNFSKVISQVVTGMSGGIGGINVQHGLAGSSSAYTLATKGYSFAEIINSLVNNEPLPASPIGPRIPGFAEGGIVMVGEHGPERVALPEGAAVYPNGSGPGGGGMVNHFYVNGTAQETAQKIGGILIDQLKSRRYLPTAG